jgi:hypothetical protein
MLHAGWNFSSCILRARRASGARDGALAGLGFG